MTKVNPTCQDCAHSRPRKPVKTYLEQWEQDTRPERPKGFLGFLRWIWNPQQFRDEHPYKDEGRYSTHYIYENHDANEIAMRKTNLKCSLNPKHVQVHKDHYCGQFSEV